jgi:hypothetical protein
VGIWSTLFGDTQEPVREPLPLPADAEVEERTIEGYTVRLDRNGTKIGLELWDDRGDGDLPIAPTLEGVIEGRRFLPAAVLLQKAKQVDDGIYAGVELAAEEGLMKLTGKKRLLEITSRALGAIAPSADSADNVAAVVLGAAKLGGAITEVPPQHARRVDQGVRELLDDPLRSKPISFYTWNDTLTRIFRQDRMLQSPLSGREGLSALVGALHRDPEARAAYEAHLLLASKMTAPFAAGEPTLSPLFAQLDRHGAIAADRARFLPPSRAPETELMKKMFGARSIPDGFDLADELVKQIRARTLDLRPDERSGWYDRQIWSFEPLVVPERMDEAARFAMNGEYTELLEACFKSAWALARETHAKQVELAMCGAAAPPKPKKKQLLLAPILTVDPLASMYRRRAESYRFVRAVLDEIFGEGAVKKIPRVLPNGKTSGSLDEELEQIESLFWGAHAIALDQLRLDPGTSGRDADADAQRLTQWAANLRTDPDVFADARMMVPVFFDVERHLTKVWCFLGWRPRRMSIDWAIAPSSISVTDAEGKDASDKVDVVMSSELVQCCEPIMREIYVGGILDRREMRRVCDEQKTERRIVERLSR